MDKILGDMVGMPAPSGDNLFSYVRYNVELSARGLQQIGISDIEPEDVQLIDSVEHIESLTRIGKAVAAHHVRPEHLI